MYIIILLSLITICLLYKYLAKKRKLADIPSPKGLPICGNALQLKPGTQHLQLTSWAEQHGGIYTLNLFGEIAIVVSGYDEIHQVTVTRGKDFAGRPRSFRFDQFHGNFNFDDPNPRQRIVKKMMMNHLKIYGSGRKGIEAIISKVLKRYISYLNSKHGEKILIAGVVNMALVDIMHVITFGNDTESAEEMALINKCTDLFVLIATQGGSEQMLDIFPFLRHFGHPTWKHIIDCNQTIDKLFTMWKERIASQETDTNFFSKLQEAKEITKVGLTDDYVKHSAFAMLAAGFATSGSAFTCLLNVLVYHPGIQEKLQQEVDDVIGDADITYDDKENLHYHQATVLEILRLTTVGPIAFHKSIVDTEISGYKIPANTMVWVNFFGLNHSKEIWQEPYQFNPNRFLDQNGKLVPIGDPNRIHLCTFGAGPRVCPGELFARSRLMIMLAMFMKEFHLLPGESMEQQPPWDCRQMKIGLVLNPPPGITVRFKQRKR